WNLAGVAAFIQEATMSDDAIAKLPEAEQALYTADPIWATSAFAIAVFGGALGSAFLLLKNKLAGPIFVASLAGIAVQMFHSFFVANSMAVYGPGAIVLPVMVLAIGVALVWWSGRLNAKGWIR
ncbi:MAG: hypothetical protein AAFW68_12610, partial [Pseudomonadota bacterium]